jgi:hypothetical protein
MRQFVLGWRTLGWMWAFGLLPGSVFPAMGVTPHSDHPRPDFKRTDWRSLNGQWSFGFDPGDVGVKEKWFEPGPPKFERIITVPFPWESKLSGIQDKEYRGAAWYAKKIDVPWAWRYADSGRRVWLTFGAVDHAATVWVNGQKVGEHVGGYTPFSFDITEAVSESGDVVVVVRVEDHTKATHPTGKQINWYTRTSGIWQPVWIESRSISHIRDFKIDTDIKKGTATFRVALTGGEAGDVVEVTAGANSVKSEIRDGAVTATLEIQNPRLWSPDDPYLYDTDVTLVREGKPVDRVRTYFGLRKVSRDMAPGRSYEYIFLNDKPVYLRGALHQSFHPDGIYQYPSSKEIEADYLLAKKLGLNFIRIHIKAEDPRALYYADKHGILLMCDVPNFWQYDDEAKATYEQTLREMIDRDYNHPSIISWCNFNETWGIGKGGYGPERWAFVSEMFDLTKKLDGTRLVEDNSPDKGDHVKTDINSWHFYINQYEAAREHIAKVVEETSPGSGFNFVGDFKQTTAPLINSEYGGISAGSGDQDISWCFKYLTNELRKHDKICGYIYTELSDIEWEHNGFVNYDRSAKDFGYDEWVPGFSPKTLNSAIFVVIDAPPCQKVSPGAEVMVPIAVNYFAAIAEEKFKIKWSVVYDDIFGVRRQGLKGEAAATCESYQVTRQDPLVVKLPKEGCVAGLVVSLVDRMGKELAANYVNFHVAPETSQAVQVLDGRRVALRFSPGDFANWEWSENETSLFKQSNKSKISGHGQGYVEYELALPDGLPYEDLIRAQLLAEVSANSLNEKLDWPDRQKPMDYPQTDGKKHPSDVQVSINGKTVREERLKDDPSDARGVLSHHYRIDPGSYGYLIDSRIAARDLIGTGDVGIRTLKIRFEVRSTDRQQGGLSIFGERAGRYAFDPTLILEFRSDHGIEEGQEKNYELKAKKMLASKETLIATAESGGHSWKYTTALPMANWMDPDFNDSSWSTGEGGFGAGSPPNSIIKTEWNTEDIWLRTSFDLEDPKKIVHAMMRLYHDEDMDIYFNGQKVMTLEGHVERYLSAGVTSQQRQFLRKGRNLLAVHCRQTTGGQNVDLGLSVVLKDRQ